MLSRAVICSGALRPVLARPLQNRLALVCTSRSAGNDVTVEEHVANWERAHKKFYGPERDLKNFPVAKVPERNPPVRLGFVPVSWMDAFYEKTGVTGPYLFGAGALTYLLSKELWVVEHGFIECISFAIAFYILQKKLAPMITKFLDQHVDDYEASRWAKPMAQNRSNAETNIKLCEDMIKTESGLKYLFESKRENVDLQLEYNYRERLADVHNAVTKRLDYHVDVENSKRRFEQGHMVNWIVNGVTAGITPQQEKDSIKQCIKDLKALSARV